MCSFQKIQDKVETHCESRYSWGHLKSYKRFYQIVLTRINGEQYFIKALKEGKIVFGVC